MRKNFRSDISIRESFYDYDQSGERIQSLVPENVRIEYFTPAYPRVRLVCSRNGDTFHNCSLSENGRVLVCNLALSRKSLGVGPLLKIVKHSVADSSFPYDFQNKEHIASTGIDLWGGPSDAGELESESVLSEVILRYGYSAYRLAVLDGFEGTEQEWLESLIGDEGKSAYQVAVDNGFEGTVAEWLASLVGAPGKSAYQVAVDNGFEGTEQEWLESLIGDEGKSAYQVAVDNGFEGTVSEWLASLVGQQGKSAYEVAVAEGYTGTEEEWIASLKGDDGNPGTTPHIGDNGHWFIGDTDTNVVALGQDGNPGITPHIGANNHWFIGETDTGILAKGTDGVTPDISIGTVNTVEPGEPAAASMSGTPEAPVLNLSIPKGLVGATPNFTVGTVTTGEPGTPVVVTITGTPEAPVLNVQIPQGLQGNPGSSVDYPFELVNNATTNDATKAATAAVAKGLKDDITQLEHEVHNLSGKFYGVHATTATLPDDADAVGYAFVGSENPYAIYNFNGTSWADSGSVANGIQGEPGVGFSSIFTPVPNDGTVIIVMSNNDTITLDLNHSHPEYFSKVLGGAQPSGGFLPDVVYSLGTLTGTVAFTLAAAVTGNFNHYFWMFDTGSTAPTITWPTGITWAGGAAPTVAANKHYEVSILGGIAYYSEV